MASDLEIDGDSQGSYCSKGSAENTRKKQENYFIKEKTPRTSSSKQSTKNCGKSQEEEREELTRHKNKDGIRSKSTIFPSRVALQDVHVLLADEYFLSESDSIDEFVHVVCNVFEKRKPAAPLHQHTVLALYHN